MVYPRYVRVFLGVVLVPILHLGGHVEEHESVLVEERRRCSFVLALDEARVVHGDFGLRQPRLDVFPRHILRFPPGCADVESVPPFSFLSRLEGSLDEAITFAVTVLPTVAAVLLVCFICYSLPKLRGCVGILWR